MISGIKNIIFDLGGVILPIDISKTTLAYKNLGILNIDELFALGHAESFFKTYEEGKISDEVFISEVRKLISTPVSDDIVTDAWNALLLDYPLERINLLNDLKKDYRLFLFSNTNGIHHTAFQEKYKKVYAANFDDMFEKAWYSHLIKLRKPDVAAFRFVIEQSNIDPAETIFVDDSLNNVKGAEMAGLKGIYLEPGKSITDLPW